MHLLSILELCKGGLAGELVHIIVGFRVALGEYALDDEMA